MRKFFFFLYLLLAIGGLIIGMSDPVTGDGWHGMMGVMAAILLGLPFSLFGFLFSGLKKADFFLFYFCWLCIAFNLYFLWPWRGKKKSPP